MGKLLAEVFHVSLGDAYDSIKSHVGRCKEELFWTSCSVSRKVTLPVGDIDGAGFEFRSGKLQAVSFFVRAGQVESALAKLTTAFGPSEDRKYREELSIRYYKSDERVELMLFDISNEAVIEYGLKS